MQALLVVLRLLGAAFIAATGKHLFMGLHADALLGVPVTADVAVNPSFDAQNRFYGVTFSLLGVVLLLASTDLKRYAPMLKAALAVPLAAGIASSNSWAIHGAPAPMLIVILVADLVLPLVCILG